MSRVTRRRGRWTYNSESTQYGEAGWHLDGTSIVLDFMPGDHQCCNGGRGCCHGSYLLYGWPGREHEPVSTHVDHAMRVIEQEWDRVHPRGAARHQDVLALPPLSPAPHPGSKEQDHAHESGHR